MTRSIPSETPERRRLPRGERIDAVIEDVIAARTKGRPIDYSAVIRANPDLMPDLGGRLERLRAIEKAAAEKPRDHEVDGVEHEVHADLSFLSQSLPGFEIIEQVDFGGQGRVFKAVQVATKRTVAIKVLLDGPFATRRQRDRFHREIELVSRLKDRRIVTVYDSGVIQGRPYLVTEYVDGIPLDDYVLIEGSELRERLALFLEVCAAVAVAHRHGVIHRDLKPSNILVDSDGCPHVLDFGLAKDAAAQTDDDSLSLAGHVIGTLAYLSPEQASGMSDQVDVRSDVYTLGVLLFEMITGTLPYRTTDQRVKVLERIVGDAPPRLRDAVDGSAWPGGYKAKSIDEDVETIVAQCLRKEPDERYQSVHALAKDVRRFLAGDPIEARAESTIYLLRKVLWKFRIHVAIALAFVVLLMGSLIGMTVLWRRAERVASIAQQGLNQGGFVRKAQASKSKGKTNAAIDMLLKAVELEPFVPLDHPHVKRQAFVTRQELAQAYFQRGEFSKAIEHCKRATELAEEFHRQDPDDVEWLRMTGFAYSLAGRIAYASDDWDQAVAWHTKAVAVREMVVKSEPDIVANRLELMAGYERLGKALRRNGELDSSIQAHLKAHAIGMRFIDTATRLAAHRLEVAQTEVSLAVTCISYKSLIADHFAWVWLNLAAGRAGQLLKSVDSPELQRAIDQTLLIVRDNEGILVRRYWPILPAG